MGKEGQKKTKKVYEDPQVVAGYIERNSRNPKLHEQVEVFVQILPGKRVIDIGCGPGHDSYKFAELGCQVVGVDYSSEMVKSAKTLQVSDNMPDFRQGDMREVGEMFDENSFDGAWISASLLHIPEEDVPKVLQGVRKILVNGGKVYIGLKAGEQGAKVIEENKYGKPMEREFVFWEKDKFEGLVKKFGFKVENVSERKGSKTGSKDTYWLNFYLEVVK